MIKGKKARGDHPHREVARRRLARRAISGEVVTMPRARYERLMEEMEELRDIAAARKALAEKDTAEYLPAELVMRELAGEHPVRIWREHRGLTLSALAEKAGLPHGYLSEIENGKKPGSVEAYRKLAAALGLSLDDLAG